MICFFAVLRLARNPNLYFEMRSSPMIDQLKMPRGKPRGIFDRKEFYLILIRSLTPQQAAVNALAIAVQNGYRAKHGDLRLIFLPIYPDACGQGPPLILTAI